MSGYVLRRLQPHAPDIIARYAHGESYDELAADFACAAGTIRRFLLSNEVPLRRPERQKSPGASPGRRS